MFSKIKTTQFTENYSDKIAKLKEWIGRSDTIVIGAGSGLSASAGLVYSGKRFEDNFADFIAKYNLPDMYSAGFYPFETLEEKWAYWSRHIYHNRYNQQENRAYSDLLQLVKDKNYFVITTNVDHLFQKSGFDKERLFYTQGDYGLWQCQTPCHNETYDNKEQVLQMVAQQKDMKIPTKLIPRCPKCHKPMDMNLRKDDCFVQDEGWHNALARYENFLKNNQNKEILFLELGIGNNTPSIIKYPFWQMTYHNKKAKYACLNANEAFAPKEIANKSLCIAEDIKKIITDLK